MNTFKIVLPVQKFKIDKVTSCTGNETPTEKLTYQIRMRFNFLMVMT